MLGSFNIQNRKLEEENMTLKQHASTLAQEKEKLEEKLTESSENDTLQALVKEALLQEPQALRSAAPRVVSLQQKLFLRQWLLNILMIFRYALTHFTLC